MQLLFMLSIDWRECGFGGLSLLMSGSQSCKLSHHLNKNFIINQDGISCKHNHNKLGVFFDGPASLPATHEFVGLKLSCGRNHLNRP